MNRNTNYPQFKHPWGVTTPGEVKKNGTLSKKNSNFGSRHLLGDVNKRNSASLLYCDASLSR